eukprot:CAMPEP_0206255376 /NCGR_PEP_ID=MMETSP0047_2-20121206/24211_1 /ASSEMBLY_ACC=CAM_ASM_000192 /TAXON_ID=195065 /ORGANISM="Chroomonas mesostigmatica_cf, Strain CCMP1168" /LENGTH=42 /DNA_ID= /DNA_START= /DNA_END= /DNA_ORIENTATION=
MMQTIKEKHNGDHGITMLMHHWDRINIRTEIPGLVSHPCAGA